MHLIRFVPLLVLSLVLSSRAFAAPRAVPEEEQTALDRYIAKPDPSYRFEVVKTAAADTFTVTTIDLTSQTWLTEKEVDHPVWKHWITVVVPAGVKSSTGMLFIGGGSIGKDAPATPDSKLLLIAKATGTVVAELRTVPNEPLIFFNDGQRRTEDGIIAYTWDKFLKTGDEKWPARLPMTKSAVRAMDTITAFCASEAGGKLKVDHFVVAGASKRGWTTWTTAAVDDRVVGIVPIVIDTLNVPESTKHHLSAYGFYSEALKDYEDMKLDSWAGTPQNAALMRIEDPYSYRKRFTMPKLMLNATGDQYFLPDNSQLYFADLPGEKFLRYVPNTDHSMKNSDAAETLLAFYQRIQTGEALPKLSWTFEKDGSIHVNSDGNPKIRYWQATNPKARDFRLETIGAAWKGSDVDVAPQGGTTQCVVKVQPPTIGWTAFFAELSYAQKDGPPLKLTTQVRVVPDVLPFEKKVNERFPKTPASK